MRQSQYSILRSSVSSINHINYMQPTISEANLSPLAAQVNQNIQTESDQTQLIDHLNSPHPSSYPTSSQEPNLKAPRLQVYVSKEPQQSILPLRCLDSVKSSNSNAGSHLPQLGHIEDIDQWCQSQGYDMHHYYNDLLKRPSIQ
jgi:hypothetical protein